MLTKTQLLTAAAIAASASTVLAAPTYDVVDIEARGPGASKAAKDTIGKAASSRAGRKVATEVGKNVYTKVVGDKLDEQKKKDAAKHSEHHHGHGKRDLEDILDELFARGPGASKAAKDTIGKAASSRAGRKVATEVGKNIYTKVAGDKLDEQKKKDAAKHSEHHHGHGKRDLEDVLDELFARGPGASKAAKATIGKAASSRAGRKVATEVGKNIYTKVAGDKLDEQKKKDAAKHSEHHGHGKRDLGVLLDVLEARDFDELEELYMRGPGASKAAKESIGKAASSRAGRKVAAEVGKHVYTKVVGDKLDEQKKKDAAKHSEHHGHGKRDLDALLDVLEAREFDELEELYMRGPGASKAAKESIGKAASSRAGRKVATEVGKNIYTKVAGDKLDEQKKKDAAKHSGHNHGKRDLESELLELITRELELYDELD